MRQPTGFRDGELYSASCCEVVGYSERSVGHGNWVSIFPAFYERGENFLVTYIQGPRM